MLRDPPDISKSGFLDLLDQIIARFDPAPPYLGGSIPCPTLPGDPPPRTSALPRAGIQLQGLQIHSISVLGRRVDVRLSPMRAVYWASNAWAIDHFHTVGQAFGFALQTHCVRLIQVRCTGTTPLTPTPWAYHTAAPVGGAGVMVARALDTLSEEGDGAGVARELFLTLLRLIRRHLAEDVPAPHTHERSRGTWRAVRTYIDENFSPAMNRQSIAVAMNLHPNYLSRLARRIAGQSFRDVLEDIRMHHAKHLLRHTDQKLHGIAAACGYSDATNFSRAFNRATGTTPGKFRKAAGNRRFSP